MRLRLSRDKRCEACKTVLVQVVFRYGSEWYRPICELGEGTEDATDD